MKIKLSKSQWEKMGNEAGWMKKEAAITQQFPAKINVYGAGNAIPVGQYKFALEIEVNVSGGTLQIPIGQNLEEVQELYQAIEETMKQTQPTTAAPAPTAAPTA